MGQVTVYHEEDNAYYTVMFDLRSSLLSDGSGASEYYLLISTSIRKPDRSAMSTYVVKALTDVPPGYSPPAASWTELCQWYIEYYMDQAELGYSTSSSSLSTDSSSSNSSSTSSSLSSNSSVSSNSSSSSTNSSSSSKSLSSLSSLTSDH